MKSRLFVLILAAVLISAPGAASAASKTTKKPAATKPATPTQVESKNAAPDQLKQIDLARKLVDTLGFGEGLPDKPAEKDYLQILGGIRTFKFEAEDVFDRQSDQIAVRNYPLYGPFSGSGWVHGTTVQTAVHFKVFLPFSGKYTLKVVTKGDNQLWSVAGRAYKLNAGEKLQESTLGQLFIPAGELEFNALIPPAGAIDSIVFTAPAYTPIEPFAGWAPEKPLTAAAANEVIASLLGLEARLPDDSSFKPRLIIVASLPGLPETVQLTDTQILGRPTEGKWVRAYQTVATISVPVEVETASVYRLRIRAVGTELSAGFGPRKATVALKPDLEWIDLGTFRLAKGLNRLELQLPPRGGVDAIEVTRKLASAADYAAATKSGLPNDTPLKAADLEGIAKSLQGQFKERQ